MGFIASSSTVSVYAKLTDAGKKKLYDSIERGSSGFVTKFGLGDSDTDYVAIDAGTPTLSSGYVPEVSNFKPAIRSFAMYTGIRNPSIPMILINGDYGTNTGIYRDLSIASNQSSTISFTVSTEWPKDTTYSENYSVEIQNTGNLTQEKLNQFFTLAQPAQRLPRTTWAFAFNGGLSTEDLVTLIGAFTNGNNGTIVPIKITGKVSGAIGIYNIRLTR